MNMQEIRPVLPTFIVAGASKAGTTALWEYLKQHPEACMTWMKEPNYFISEGRHARYHLGITWYQSLFQGCEGAKAVGDVSPACMTQPDSPGLIFQTVPDVQLLFILRDPVERIYSQYRYARHLGRRLPTFEQLVRDRPPVYFKIIELSSYELYLQRFLEFFPQKQLLI